MDETAGARHLGRLRTSAEFQRTFKAGRRVDGPLFLLIAMAGATSQIRLGLAVGRKVGGAVVRNRAKRRLREAFRQCARRAEGAGWDVVIVAKPGLRDVGLQAILDELARRFARLSRPHRRAHPPADPLH